jgi:anti-sigma B factor antagonist
MKITEETRSGWHVIMLNGRADALTADSVEQALKTAAQAHTKIAVDLSGLDYVSSAGVRSFLQGARAAQLSKAEFVVCAPKQSVKDVFKMSGLHNVIRIEGELPC